MKKIVLCCIVFLALLLLALTQIEYIKSIFAAEQTGLCPQNGKDEVRTESLECFYHENGVLKTEVPFKDGKREGLAKDYYESGALKGEMPYKDDKMEGLGKAYYENGELKGEILYRNGEPVKQ